MIFYLIKKTDFTQYPSSQRNSFILEVNTLPVDYQKDYFLMEKCWNCAGIGEYDENEPYFSGADYYDDKLSPSYVTCEHCYGYGYSLDKN